MKLEKFKIEHDYVFELYFENGIHGIFNLENLIKSKVSKNDLKTARIDKDWGCLEFKDGLVDIEPSTLYKLSKLK